MTVADPGEGPRWPPPTAFFWTKMRPKGPKHFCFETPPPPPFRVWMTAPAPLSEGLDLPLHEQQPQGQSTNIYYLKLKYKGTMKDSTDQPFFFLLDSQKITSIQ